MRDPGSLLHSVPAAQKAGVVMEVRKSQQPQGVQWMVVGKDWIDARKVGGRKEEGMEENTL